MSAPFEPGAGRISARSIERVRDAADMITVVSKRVDLRRAGTQFSGLCPFHEERSPSFSVNPADKVYHCFGCQAGGDIFRFVAETESVEFPEAVELLAAQFGVELEREGLDPQAEENRRRRARLYEALARAEAYYANYLWDVAASERSRRYLRERGLREEVLRAFGVGMAPANWDSLLVRGQRASYSVDELHAAGLIQKGGQGGFYDRFRSRILFPIRDHRGRTLGFGARGLSPDARPKYINSPEGELYHKSSTLYGIDLARGPITRAGSAVVVEGYTDVLALHQAGIDQAVAVMGTAITPEQLKMLRRYCDRVVLALDADRAGREAMLRARRVAGSEGLKLRVAAMPVGTDPAEMLATGGADRFRELVEQAEDLSVFHIRSILAESELESAEGRDAALGETVPVLAGMGETISRDEMLREVASRLDADPGFVARLVKERAVGGALTPRSGPLEAAAPEPSGRPIRSPRPRREHAFLAMCVAEPGEGELGLGAVESGWFSDPLAGRAALWLRDHLEAPDQGHPADDPPLASLLERLVKAAEQRPVESGAIEVSRLKIEQAFLEDRLVEVGRSDDTVTLIELQRRRAAITERLAGRGTVAG